MTIDIKIGKLKIKTTEELVKERIKDKSSDTIWLIEVVKVVECPEENDGCTSEDTIFPNRAYRSGSNTGISKFFNDVMPGLISKLRPIKSNDYQVSLIKPHIEEINNLVYKGNDEYHIKRLQWLKFWCNRAVELYDNEAAISFS